MREIKFRVWCESNKEMYYPDNVYELWFDNKSIGFYPRYDKDELQHYNTIPSDHEKEITVMQFTGKKDVMKIDIYEGDIVEFTDYGIKTAVVSWLPRAHAFVLENQSYGKNHTKLTGRGKLKIIGNIHQNPELL